MQSRPVAHTSRELVRSLRQELDRIEFPFPAAASVTAEARRAALARDLDEEIVGALDAIGDPAMIALVGPTGVGKSVLANSLIGASHSSVSALRPATDYPQLLAHPDTIALQGDNRVRKVADLVTVLDGPLGWAILDCGDPFAAGNDPLRAQPDVSVSAWLAVTSALRYGDSSVWDLLGSLAAGPEPIALVVNRVPEGAWPAISQDIKGRLKQAGLGKVALLQIVQAEGAPDVLPRSAVASVRRWLTARFPIPERPAGCPEVREALSRVAEEAVELANAEAVHQASVELLRGATDAKLAEVAEATALATPSAADSRLAGVWLDQIGPDGPLTDVNLLGEVSEERRERVSRALAALGRAVSDAVQPDFRTIMTDARAAMIGVWQGAGVPEGTRVLLERRGLAEPELGKDLAGSAGYGLWVEGLMARLRERHDAATKAATDALTRTGMVSLVQAAALGAEGPGEFAARLLGDQFEPVLADGHEALRQARASSVRLALAVFTDTVRELERTASGTLSWAASRLAYAAKKVDK
ncbi:MAG: hypothetical protein LBJ02_09800 [Bifidobacteriaceae bacterium]|jgi:hypothetical protein|nr:hypothetical protein [Bifidobacteriaceae bacterium]